MPEPTITEPRTPEAGAVTPLNAGQKAMVEEIGQTVSEIRDEATAVKIRLEDTESGLTAIRQTLSKGSVQDAMDKVIALEEKLAERISDIDLKLGRMSHGPDPSAGDGVPRMRAQAMEILNEVIARNPVMAENISHDPALTDEYQVVLINWLANGKDSIYANADRRALAATAGSFQQRVYHDPLGASQAGGISKIVNTLSTDFDPGWGMAVPIPIATRIVRRASEFSPLLVDSGQASTTSRIYPYLVDTGNDPEVRVRGERQDVIEDDDNDELFQEKEIIIYEENVTTRLTLVMIEDGIDVIREYETRTARSLGKVASQKIHFGSGTKQPLGLLNDLTVVRVKTETTNSLPFRVLMNVAMDMDPEFEANARFYLSKGGLKAAVLADDGEGRFLWQSSQQDGTPSLLHGFTWKKDAYLTSETDVKDTGVEFATGAFPAFFGNPAEACLMVERLGLQVGIDDITKKGWRKYWTRRRWGWGVVNPAALRLVEVGVTA